MGLGLKRVLEREKNQWPNGKVVMASHSTPLTPHHYLYLSQRHSSTYHLLVFKLILSLKEYEQFRIRIINVMQEEVKI